MSHEFLVVGYVLVDVVNRINRAVGHDILPNDKNTEVVLNKAWFRNHIDNHYPHITEDEAVTKVKRVLNHANHIYYGTEKNGLLYIEMNSVHKEIIVLKYSHSYKNFMVDTAYPFSNIKLVSLTKSHYVHDVT